MNIFHYKSFIVLLLLGTLSAVIVCSTVQAIFAVPTNVKVTICRVKEISFPDNIFGTPGNYFANVRIGNNVPIKSSTVNPENVFDVPYWIYPDWKFERQVESSNGLVPIVIVLGDEDDIDDDAVDINPKQGKITVDLLFNLTSGRWQGDVPFNVDDSSGPVDGTFDRDGSAQVFFDVQVSNTQLPSDNCAIDTDDDGMPDRVELNGIVDKDGFVIADLPHMGIGGQILTMRFLGIVLEF